MKKFKEFVLNIIKIIKPDDEKKQRLVIKRWNDWSCPKCGGSVTHANCKPQCLLSHIILNFECESCGYRFYEHYTLSCVVEADSDVIIYNGPFSNSDSKGAFDLI